jgi:hypothetical protein
LWASGTRTGDAGYSSRHGRRAMDESPVARNPADADGKPDLAAPAPKTADGKPDFSGVWGLDAGPSLFWIGGDPKGGYAKPVVGKYLAEREANLQFDDQIVHCLPEGPRFSHFVAFPKKIVQTPTLILVLGEDLSYRQIFMDGRPLPKDPNPSFMGYSVGRWDGDTLVVDSLASRNARGSTGPDIRTAKSCDSRSAGGG